ncbi:MAG: hypothetical protein OEY44_04440, partial [Candidatus Peregrinibacteria bacterium]|nr:hypothetical protein [Candidatus Peregrinibacteria bacterium]
EWDPCVEDDGGNKKASADETPPTLIFQPIVTFNAFGIDQPTGQKSPSEPYVERTSHGIHLHPTLLYPLYWNQTYSNMAYYVGLTAGASIGFTSYTLEWVEPVMENDRHVRDDTTTLDSFNTMDYGGSLGLVAALAGRHELEIGSYGGWVDWGMLGVNYTERRSARSFHFLFGSVLFQIGLGYSITKGAFAEHERNGASFMAFLMPLLVPIL